MRGSCIRGVWKCCSRSWQSWSWRPSNSEQRYEHAQLTGYLCARCQSRPWWTAWRHVCQWLQSSEQQLETGEKRCSADAYASRTRSILRISAREAAAAGARVELTATAALAMAGRHQWSLTLGSLTWTYASPRLLDLEVLRVRVCGTAECAASAGQA